MFRFAPSSWPRSRMPKLVRCPYKNGRDSDAPGRHRKPWCTSQLQRSPCKHCMCRSCFCCSFLGRSCTAMPSSLDGWFSNDTTKWTDDSWQQHQRHHREESQCLWRQSDAGSWGKDSSNSSSSSDWWPDSNLVSIAGTECKFKNCTTLGEKHPLPLDDRKDLLVALFSKFVALLQESASGLVEIQAFPRVAVGAWGATAVQASFFIVCRVQPSFALRPLRNRTVGCTRPSLRLSF
mgnify:CR=1 FL=1